MFISREISERMSEQARDQMYGSSLPKLKFFKPKKKFWETIQNVYKANNLKMTADCGAGNGHIARKARHKYKLKMTGLDIVAREGNEPCEVQLIPAHQLPYSKEFWPMVCRPDHSGWVQALIEKAFEEGSGFIYVGLRKNMPQDLGKYLLKAKFETFTNVGKDREEMLVFKPQEIN